MVGLDSIEVHFWENKLPKIMLPPISSWESVEEAAVVVEAPLALLKVARDKAETGRVYSSYS